MLAGYFLEGPFLDVSLLSPHVLIRIFASLAGILSQGFVLLRGPYQEAHLSLMGDVRLNHSVKPVGTFLGR